MGNNPQVDINASKLGASKSFHFPSDLPIHFISFTFMKYSWEAQQGTASLIKEPTLAVYLPVPNELNDALSIAYQDVNRNIGQMEAMNGAVKAVSNATSLSDVTSQAGTLAKNVLDASGKALGYAALDKATSLAGENSLAQATGIVTNPNTTMAFKQVAMKKHSFSWILAPKSKAESQTVANIIKGLKTRILPAINSQFFLDYPDICQVQIHGSGAASLYPFKKCFVEGLNVGYAPFGPAFFAGGGDPVAVSLQINLTETTIWNRTDLDGITDDSVNSTIEQGVKFTTGLADQASVKYNQIKAKLTQPPPGPSGPLGDYTQYISGNLG